MNWAILIFSFIPLLFVLQHLIPPLIADVVLISIAFCVYFFVLHKRTIFIECPHCNGYIESNTPWICGNKDRHCRNDRVDDFPFIYHCEHCGFTPKAYKCHHCEELIYLTKDRQETAYARCADVPSKPPPVRRDKKASKIAEQDETIHNLRYELKETELKAAIKEVKAKIEPVKLKTTRERIRSNCASRTELDDEVRRMHAEIDEEFKDDPVEREKRHRTVDDEATNML